MKCKLCNSNRTIKIDTKIRNIKKNELNVYECKNCEVHFLDSKKTIKDLKSFYKSSYRILYNNEEYYEEDNINIFFNQQIPEAKNRVNRIKNYLNKTDNILEIGCSSGYFLYEAKNYVNKCFGVE